MAVDLVSTPFSAEAGPRPLKRRRLGWDVPDPAILAESGRLQLQLASHLLQVYPSFTLAVDHQSTGLRKVRDQDISSDLGNIHNYSKDLCKEGGKQWLGDAYVSSAWHEDDKDGHFNFDVGDNLTSRYKILQKMGQGTFGRVLACLDLEAQEVVAIKVVRSAQKYREDAMIEIGHLQTLSENDKTGSRGKAHKYFRHERRLNWPDSYTSKESLRAVDRLPRLRDLVMKHVDKSASTLASLLEQMLCYDPSERLTAREALRHPFFQVQSERRLAHTSSGSSAQ